MSSTFYTDGYNDGLDNNPKSTMNVRKNGKGQETNIHNTEYNQGYVDAQRDVNRVLKTMAQVGYSMLTEPDQKIADYVLD